MSIKCSSALVCLALTNSTAQSSGIEFGPIGMESMNAIEHSNAFGNEYGDLKNNIFVPTAHANISSAILVSYLTYISTHEMNDI